MAKVGIIKRVSILVDGPAVEDGLAELKSLALTEMGLHFALNQSSELTRPRAFLRHLINAIRPLKAKQLVFKAELERQWSKLESLSIRPVYVDGHHHVHVFPGVAPAIAECMNIPSYARQVRLPIDQDSWNPRKTLISIFGILARRTYLDHGWRVGPFSYPMGHLLRDPLSLASHLLSLPETTEVIFHPAAMDDLAAIGSLDTYRSQRVREFRCLERLPAALNYLHDLRASAVDYAPKAGILIPNLS